MLRLLTAILAASLAGACAREPDGRRYTLEGQILAVHGETQQVLITHEDIAGFMPAMTMMFSVADPALLKDKTAGDLVTAVLLVGDTHAQLLTLEKTGHAPLPPGSAAPAAAPAPILEPGQPVPNQVLTDQQGRTRRLADWRGQALALTFIYTRCPMPEYCPRMDRQFAELQRTLTADPRLAGRARLLSISFDPEHDTPDVLAAHARRLGADPAVWTFAAPPAADHEAFAARFGVFIERPAADPVTITHNLRTAVVNPHGRVVKVYTGNEWTPAQVLADLLAIVSAR